MPVGPIIAERRSERVDRSGEELALWEVGPGMPVQLPYVPAAFAADRIARVLKAYSRAAVAVGASPASAAFLEAAINAATAGSRIYVYAADALIDSHRDLVARLAGMGDRILARFGPAPPADWVIADGQRGLLQFGAPGGERRWIVDISDQLGRTLLKAFALAFWHYARREGLPDQKGGVALHAPLPAPMEPAPPRVELASGWFWYGSDAPASIADAQIRVLPLPGDGPASLVFLPPAPDDFASPGASVASGARVVWSDLGLPKTAVSTERMTMDFIEGPLGLQLEWPKGEAIRLLQSLKTIAAAPQFEFYSKRALGDLGNAVLLPGWTRPQTIAATLAVDLGDIVAPLDRFESIRPDLTARIAEPALSIDYGWRVRPETPPEDAREATLVRQWRLLDEWGARTVQMCRTMLDQLERNRPGGGDDTDMIAGLSIIDTRDELTDIAQAPLSRDGERAGDAAARLGTLARHLREALERAAQTEREAVLNTEEDRQRSEWSARRAEAASALAELQGRVTAQEDDLAKLEERLAASEAELAGAARRLRDDRRAEFKAQVLRLESEIDQVRAELAEADSKQPGGRAPKSVRKDFNKKISELDQQRAAVSRDLGAMDRWSPPPEALADVRSERQRILLDIGGLRAAAREGVEMSKRLAREAGQAFVFQPPPLPHPAPIPAASDAPRTPEEALPEIGELLEHRDQRYLAIKTWAQFDAAIPVARRLQAVLVSSDRGG